MTRAIIAAFLLFLAAPAYAAGQEYQYPADGFAANFPSQPTLQTLPQTTPAGQVELHNYVVSLDADNALMVSATQFPATANTIDERTVDVGAMNGSAKMTNATVTSQTDVTLGSHPGIQAEMSDGTHRIVARYFFVNFRLYVLTAVSPLTAPVPPEAQVMLDSFRLVDAH